jgi:diguanylate cyclase (GGDEF)-like protein
LRPAEALDPRKAITQYVQTIWNTESGLPENSVHSIAQTADGYLWMGTEEGLTRFDGVQFVTYTNHNAPGLASDSIQVLAASRDGSLWIGTDSGLSHYVPGASPGQPGTFVKLTTRDGLSGNLAAALAEDRAGALWLGTAQGLNRIVNGRVESWTTGHGLPDAAVRALAVDSGGTLWVGTARGLARFANGRFAAETQSAGVLDDNISALAAAPDGALWVGTQSHGLVRIRGGQIEAVPVRLSWTGIRGLLVDRDGGVWIVFDRHGIGRLYEGRLDVYGAAQGLPTDLGAYAVFEDREGSLWVGTQDAGAAQLRDDGFSVYGKLGGLSSNYVGEVAQGPDGSMYFGMDLFGVNRLYPDGRVEVLDQRRGLPNQAVYSLLVARDGSLWIGYPRGTLAHLDQGRVSVWQSAQDAQASLVSLFQDRDGGIWVGFSPTGLAYFENGEFHHVTSRGIVDCITQSQDGALWAGTDGDGVQRYFRGTMTGYGAAEGLPNEHALYVYADADDSVWVGQASGNLSRIANGKITTWTPRQGIPDTDIGSILEDNLGNFWMGGNNGIFRVARAELMQTANAAGGRVHARVYGQSAGVRISETVFGSMPAAWKGRDGRLWFATIGGAAMVDPAHLPAAPIPPPVAIERVAVDSRPVTIKGGMRLGPSPVNLEVSFSAPTFVAPQMVRFRYRLYGFDRDWVRADARSARYTNLPAGRYQFAVQAQNADGVWSETGAGFGFILLPPLRETPTAYAIYTVAALLCVWGLLTLRTRNLLRRQQELTRVVAERTAQLETEKTELEAARRELHVQATHDSLTGLFNRGAILEHLQREIARAVRERQPLGVVLADLDNFKNVNDEYGHLCGDDVLRETAARLRAAVRSYDVVGRYGGEEFLILFPGWDLQLEAHRIEELLDAIRLRPYRIENEAELHLTCSAGVAVFRPNVDEPTTREVLKRADTALYVAKSSGRNNASLEVRPSI